MLFGVDDSIVFVGFVEAGFDLFEDLDHFIFNLFAKEVVFYWTVVQLDVFVAEVNSALPDPFNYVVFGFSRLVVGIVWGHVDYSVLGSGTGFRLSIEAWGQNLKPEFYVSNYFSIFVELFLESDGSECLLLQIGWRRAIFILKEPTKGKVAVGEKVTNFLFFFIFYVLP